MSCRKNVEHITAVNSSLRKYLFTRGYLLSDVVYDLNTYPFYGNWSQLEIGSFRLYLHNKLKAFKFQNDEDTYLLIGHAYNPYNGVYDENELLQSYAEADDKIEALNQWTGVFTLIVICDDSIEIWDDCAGMQAAYYGFVKGHFYVSSHAQLIGDLCDLQQSAYVRSMVKYRFWQLYGMFLPGDLSQFDGVYRVVPNTYVTFRKSDGTFAVNRFYPTQNIAMCKTKQDYDATIDEICDLLHTNLELISKKWKKPAIEVEKTGDFFVWWYG